MTSYWKQPNKQYDVSCAGLPGVVRLDVITAKIETAQGNGRGAQASRDFLAMQFKKAYISKTGRPLRQYVGFERLRFVPVEPDGALAQVQQQGCGGDECCKMCDLGYHERCRNNCPLG